MTRRATRVVWAGFAAATLAALVGCAAAGDGADGLDAADDPVPLSDDAYADVPEGCRENYPFAALPADIADVGLQPVDWPAPPADATLCLTTDTVGGSIESAAYATNAAIDDVLAHYESALAAYDVFRTSGADNGTGYETLDGTAGDVEFQIRESDGGFLLVFGLSDTGG